MSPDLPELLIFGENHQIWCPIPILSVKSRIRCLKMCENHQIWPLWGVKSTILAYHGGDMVWTGSVAGSSGLGGI